MATKRANLGDAAVIRRTYQKARLFVPAARARADVISLLEERKALQRASEKLVMASLPFSGDPGVKAAIDELRALLEGRAEVAKL